MLEIIIFKISRCGSTVLENLIDLATPSDYVILHEPPNFSQVAMNLPLTTDIETGASLLGSTLDAYRDIPVVINCYSQLCGRMLFLVPMLRRIGGPNLRIFFLWRSPLEVAMSHQLRPASWVSSQDVLLSFLKTSIQQFNLAQTHTQGGVVPMGYEDIFSGRALRLMGLKAPSPEAIEHVLTKYWKKAKGAGKYDRGKEDHHELFATEDLRQRFGYIEEFLQFQIDNPPYPWSTLSVASSLATSFTTSDDVFAEEEVLRYLSSDNTFQALRCSRPNDFIWHFPPHHTPEVVSKWVRCSYASYKASPDLMVVDRFKDTKATLRLSHKGAVSCLHYDTSGRVLNQLWGEKRILLFPPEAALKWYPATDKCLSRRSILGIYDIPTPTEDVHLQAGRELFIPPFWGHLVITLSESCTIVESRSSATDPTIKMVSATPEEIATAEGNPRSCKRWKA
jgi:hypothetical protein